jgi:phospholipase/lecithinase/hemolysin
MTAICRGDLTQKLLWMLHGSVTHKTCDRGTFMRLISEVSKSVRFAPLLLAFATTFAYAQNYDRLNNIKTIVVFGDSLSDTGNVSHLTGGAFPSPAMGYAQGRFTDGADSTPYARKYFGVWVEQFAASLPSRPEVRNSLDGGTDYAYGFAESDASVNGTSPTVLGVEVNDIGHQIADYLSTHPAIDDRTLFIVWGGANDLLHTPPEMWPNVIPAAVINMTLNIKKLIDAGATQFIVANLPPLGLTPAGLASGFPDEASAATGYFNSALAGGISLLREAYPDENLAIFQLDVFSLFQQIVDSPTRYSLMNVTAPSQYPTNPDAYLANPDTYLFWDTVHPTTRGHSILAEAAKHLVAEHSCDASGQDCVYPVPQQCNGKHCAIPVN